MWGNMSVPKFSIALMLLLVLASQFLVSMTEATVSENEATSALTNAENTVNSAYQAASKAEESGANVSSLLVRLNEAGLLLNRAHMAFKSGDFDSTLTFATQSQEKLNGFVADADVLRENAIRDNYLDFMINVVGSIIGFAGTVCAGFLVWLFLKRKYEKIGSAA
jgi:hypothetical protein